MTKLPDIDDTKRTQIEAAAFRKLCAHLQKYPEVQNIELMNLAYFCRNCMAKWLVASGKEAAVEIDYDEAREHVYGMPYADYKQTHQTKATPEQLAAFKVAETKASV